MVFKSGQESTTSGIYHGKCEDCKKTQEAGVKAEKKFPLCKKKNCTGIVYWELYVVTPILGSEN